MRTIKPNVRRRPAWQHPLLFALLLLGGGAATVAALVGAGAVDAERLAFWRPRAGFPKDWIAVPVSARDIPAFTQITRDHLLTPGTLQLSVLHLPPSAVPKNALMKPSEIVGRVLSHKKSPLYCFSEDDFLPIGSHAGVAGGTPLGKRAVTLDASKIRGVHELQAGDRFDLLASTSIDMPGTGHSSDHGGTSVMTNPAATLLPKRGVVQPIVEDGVVISPVHTRNAPMTSSSLMGGASTRTVPVQEIIVAVDPVEVARILEAIDLKYEICCDVRSGRAEQNPGQKQLPEKATPESPQEKQHPQNVVNAAQVASTQAATSQKSDSQTATSTAKPKSTPATSSPASVALADDSHIAKKDFTPGLNPMENTRSIDVVTSKGLQRIFFQGGSPLPSGPVNASSATPESSTNATTP